MFLENIPMMYQLKAPPLMLKINDLELSKYTTRKWSLGVECSYCTFKAL